MKLSGWLVLGLAAVTYAPTAEASWSQLKQLYCGNKNCYEILGVERDADGGSIKRAFHRLSLQWHPDKNPEESAAGRFRDIAKAYEVLSSPQTREAYNYFLDDPESFYSLYYGYRAVYPSQTHPLIVIIALLLFLSLGQYLNASWKYDRCRASITRSDQFKKAVESELSDKYRNLWGKMSSTEQEGARKAMEEQIMRQRVQVDGSSPRPMEWSNLAIFQILLVPVNVARWLQWEIRWFWLFTLKRLEYGAEEEAYLTRKTIRLTGAKWDRLDDLKRSELIQRKLWIGENYAAYLKEENERERDSRISSAKYKQWKRWKKKNPDTSYMMDD